MENYIDGFVYPIQREYLNEYKAIAQKIADIWKEHGALAYYEYVGDDLKLEGTKSFVDAVQLKEGEVVVFGWVVFPSKEVRDDANKQVPSDSRMSNLIEPLIDPNRMIFDGSRMIYGGFQSLIQSE